ncbi:cache domain-containing sensor histidine kinase [Paenibacillus aestuarii]|uniref:Sensor histidine kinase n=1 Tax=Paenibacillus aestuarii TaxID=516965 RepID=A0ABW0K639_9BACL|nr:sensor histidine kinase [Paenibacillus aestuarii]
MHVSVLKTWSLRTKFMIILVLFILFPLMTFGLLFYQSSKDLVSQRTDKEGQQVLTLVNQNVTQLLKGYESRLNEIYENEDLLKQISPSYEGKAEQDEANDDSVNRFLRDYLRSKDDLDSVYLITNKQTYFGDFKGSEFFMEQYRKHANWEDFISLANGRAVWLPSYELPPNQYNSKPSHYFSVGMQIKDVYDSLQTLGTLIANVKIDALDKIISNVQVSPHSVLFISDHQGRIIWNRNPDAYAVNLSNYSFFTQLDQQKEGHFTQSINDSSYRVTFLRSDYNGWYYFSFVPQTDLNAQTNDLKRFLAATLIAFGALFIMLAAFTSNYITRPLRQMAVAMKQIHKDNYEMTTLTPSSDEMGMLHSAFLTMRGRINDLIKEVRLISNKEKEAEIRALQAQINPHFVYNSLDAINWMAIENDEPRISRMITSLSDIMRYAIKPGEQLVSIDEELKWAQNYAYLQEMRFEDKFEVVFDVRLEERSWKVPRLMFQPYLENSIIHGMETVDTGGIIRITVQSIGSEQEPMLMVMIEDNGSGISPEKLEQIKQRQSHGIGIYNLDERLKMEYGPHYGTSIQSVYGEGTTITLVLPFIR